MKNLFLLLFLLLIFFAGCGQSAKQKKDAAILSARISLTYGRCQEAIDTLESIGRDSLNADYVTTLSSAYSCRAGFSQIVFFGTDVGNIDGSNIEGSFTKFSTSPMTGGLTPDTDPKFSDLQVAIDILLYAGNLSAPSHAARSTYFNNRDLGNISTQALYMVIAQLGKFSKYYGNADAAGMKGLGTEVNSCYFEYDVGNTDAMTALALLNAGTTNDTCDAGGVRIGHPDLDIGTETAANIKKRMCRGVVLFNNFIDVFTGTVLSAGAEFADLRAIQDDISSFITACSVTATGTPLGGLCNERSQSNCEATTTIPLLETYFAAIFEPVHF